MLVRESIRVSRVLALSATMAAAACSYVPNVSPYRIDIQQGNYVTQEMVSQLKPGMSREQVRFVLGTPLVADIFHADRWDYVYFRDPRFGAREKRRFSVFFVDGKLARVDGDVVPAAPKTEAPAEAIKPAPPAPEPAVPQQAKPAAPVAPQGEEPTTQNWSTASDQVETKPEPVVQEQEPGSPEAEKKERGFFGRMLEKIGL